MFDLIKSLFGLGPKTDFKALYADGAKIIDVRTPREFAQGHIKGAINIPLDKISGHLKKIKAMDATIITCCASGMRSGIAKSKLKAAGVEVYNGGGWERLKGKLTSALLSKR